MAIQFATKHATKLLDYATKLPSDATKLPNPATKPATKPANATKLKGGRPTLGDAPMTSTERSRKHRAKP